MGIALTFVRAAIQSSTAGLATLQTWFRSLDLSARLIGLVSTVSRSGFCFGQNCRYLFLSQRLEVPYHIQGLVQDFHRVAARDADAKRQIHAKFQALHRSYGFTL